MNEVKVSVCIPCYNHGKFVKDAIDAILNQTYQNFELLIVENGSTDNSREVIRQYEGTPRVRIFYFDENDLTKASLLLYAESKGEYYAWTTADDIWERTKLEKQVAFLDENQDYLCCFTWARYCDENMNLLDDDDNLSGIFFEENRTPGKWLRRFWDGGNCISCPSMLIRSKEYEQFTKKKSVFWQIDDLKTWVNFINSGYKFWVIQETLIYMRKHDGSMSFSETAQYRFANEMASLRIMLLEDIPNEIFIEGFGDSFVNQEASSPEDLLCEKIFVLIRLAQKNRGIQLLLPDFIYRYAPLVLDELQEKYGVDREFIKTVTTEYGMKYLACYFYELGHKAE